MDPAPITLSSVAPAQTSFVPPTNRLAGAWGKFRILIIGHSGAGKSSLINATFQASLTDVQHGRLADINREFVSPHNKHLTLHDSQGYDQGNSEKFDVLQRFITKYTKKEPVSERLHAIWLCIAVPFPGDRILEIGDEKIFKLYRYTVPIVVVFTKFDLYMERLEQDGLKLAEILFKRNYDQILENLTESMACQIPYALVTISQPETWQKLVEITMQRIVISQKITASISVGKKRYWKTILSGIQFLRFSLQRHLYAIHKDLVTLWNIRNTDEFLSDAFCRRVAFLSDGFTNFGTQNGWVGRIYL
ncbi:hypothetical protein F5887DRAFT_120086 [Amanita rubescens]|nr:hypothetical protein F5887DRAFT_120086 [Amanita rubescens]